MTFDVERRKVYVTPVADLGGCSGRKPAAVAKKAAEYPKLVNAARKVLDRYPDERVLLHTVSYDLAAYVMKGLAPTHGHRLVTYTNAAGRDPAIEQYRQKEAGVLIASSLERGADFKHDDCRVVVVCKIPFPNLGDPQINARLYSRGGDLWYRALTVRSLVQMCGRGTRSADDFSENFILDRQFVDNVWKKSKSLLPEWWRESIDMSATFVKEFTS